MILASFWTFFFLSVTSILQDGIREKTEYKMKDIKNPTMLNPIIFKIL